MGMLGGVIRRNRFLVLGRAGMDLYADPPGTLIEEARGFFSALGGSAANIAVAITRLGGEASLLTAVSNDAVGRFTLSELRRYGVGTEYVRAAGGEVRTSLAVVETRAENCQSVIYRHGAADFLISAEDVEEVDFGRFGALIVTGTSLAVEPSRAATFTALKLARVARLPVILDVDYRPYSWRSAEEAASTCRKAAELSDIVVGNDDEFTVMAGSISAGRALAESLAGTNALITVYKMGAKGSFAYAGVDCIETGIFTVDTLKPTGAGDAFMGGFVSSLAAGLELRDALRRGSAAAAIVVSRVGCAPAMPDASELNHFLASRQDSQDQH